MAMPKNLLTPAPNTAAARLPDATLLMTVPVMTVPGPSAAIPLESVANQPPSRLAHAPQKAPNESPDCPFVKNGVISLSQWDSLSKAEQAHLGTAAAWADWNHFGPALKTAISQGFRTHAQKGALEVLTREPHAQRVDYLKTCRLGGCELDNPAVTRFLTQSATACATIPALIEAGVTLTDDAISDSIRAIAVLSTHGKPYAYEHKQHALTALTDLAVARALAIQDVKCLEIAGGHAKTHGGLAWNDLNSRYVEPATPYHEYGVLTSLVGAGCRVTTFQADMLNRGLSYQNGNPIPFLAELGTYRKCDPAALGHGASKAVPIDFSREAEEAIRLAVLLQHDVNARSTEYDIAAIHLAACAHSPDGQVIRRLATAGADLEALAKFGDYLGEMRPLGWALCGALDHANTGTLDALLERGANPNALDGDNKTVLERLVSLPYMWKVPAAGLAAARSLLGYGAHFSSQVSKDAATTALHEARQRAPGEATIWDEWAQMLRQLPVAP
ncbi:hypothetical protein [Stenotrophomonas sp. AB1(2024)]|uniref:hypothetical protein n=1 Tax=Stenotrophomonas sp. AB1(2024) TaxID=3132215 RepID=UPI0030A728C0